MQINELNVKYQQLTVKVKDMVQKWHGMVKNHSDFLDKLAQCEQWISDREAYLKEGLFQLEQREEKLDALNSLLAAKDDGFSKIQHIIEEGQIVLSTTSSEGHEAITKEIDNLQRAWSAFISLLGSTKLQIDEQIRLLSAMQQEAQALNAINKEIKNVLSLPNVKDVMSALDLLNNLESRNYQFKADAEHLKGEIVKLNESMSGCKEITSAEGILEEYHKLSQEISGKSANLLKLKNDMKNLAQAKEALKNYIQRCRDKINTMKQRSPNDKNYFEAVIQALDHLMNKEAQGQILLEQMELAAQTLFSQKEASHFAIDSEQDEVKNLIETYNDLFNGVRNQRHEMDKIMQVFQKFKEDTERLSDWLQQMEVNIKAAKTSLQGSLAEKETAVIEGKATKLKLSKDAPAIENYKKLAAKLENTCLEANVNAQREELLSRYDKISSLANDVLNKITIIYDQHKEFQVNYEAAKSWIENGWSVIRKNTVTEGRSRQDLHNQLDALRSLVNDHATGQSLVHKTLDCGEKTLRNTRSDGKEIIQSSMKELQLDWERLQKKMSSSKVLIETDLLQWTDAEQNISRVKDWIRDKENRLKQASQARHVMITRRSALGISTLSVSERTAALQDTNNILQDIQAYEPMIESINENLSVGDTPVCDLKNEYQQLSLNAQKLYDTEKEMVEKHEAFMDYGHSFMNWLRTAKETLVKIADPVGDRETLTSKIAQLHVLEAEKDEGKIKLEESLRSAADACVIALADDKEIVEEEAAFLQDEFDQFVEALTDVKESLQGALVQWNEFEEQLQTSTTHLQNTMSKIKGFNQYHDSLQKKRESLEEFQGLLQGIFEWEKELDKLNDKAQALLETCSDSKISNSVTQVTSKYHALISMAKDVMRRLEMQYQEHYQHATVYQDCVNFLEVCKQKLEECRECENTHDALSKHIKAVNDTMHVLDQSQMKIHYLQELKDRVIATTDPSGAGSIESSTNQVKKEFDALVNNALSLKRNLTNRFELLGDIEKSNKLLLEWIEEAEAKVLSNQNNLMNTLGEKMAYLEKNKAISKELDTHKPTVLKLEEKLQDHKNVPNIGFANSISRYHNLTNTVQHNIEQYTKNIAEHEKYNALLNQAHAILREVKLQAHNLNNVNGEKKDLIKTLQQGKELSSKLQNNNDLLKQIIEQSKIIEDTTSKEGNDNIKQEIAQLKYEWDQQHNQIKQSCKNIERCLEAWTVFETTYDANLEWIKDFKKKVNAEESISKTTLPDLERRRSLMNQANKRKLELEGLNDKGEILTEYSGNSSVRDKVVQLQTEFTNIYIALQDLLSKAESSICDCTEFEKALQEFQEWNNKAVEAMQDVEAPNLNQYNIEEKIDALKTIISQMSEGQHLVNCVKRAYTSIIDVADDAQKKSMLDSIEEINECYETLNESANKQLQVFMKAQQDVEFVEKALSNILNWANDTEQLLIIPVETNGEIGEMKSMHEKSKFLETEINERQRIFGETIENLDSLPSYCDKEKMQSKKLEVANKLQDIQHLVKKRIILLESDMKELKDYQATLQEVEKWLLQKSFQLMAHNSLYISTKQQAKESITSHNELMAEIHAYQKKLVDVQAIGKSYAKKYANKNPKLPEKVLTQHQNFQESYNSLVQTATQIKNRLCDSLKQFEEYEETLESILSDLVQLKPKVETAIEKPIENIGDVEGELNEIKVCFISKVCKAIFIKFLLL